MTTFAIPLQNGALAERLGTGLQNLLQRFDSARHLQKTPLRVSQGRLQYKIPPKSFLLSAIFTDCEITDFAMLYIKIGVIYPAVIC